MIFESHVWKDELAQDLRAVMRRIQKAKVSGEEKAFERAAVTIEKFVFTSAFIIRKLVEAQKLSDEFETTSVSIQAFQRINHGRPIHFINRHYFDEFYDLDKPHKVTLSTINLCNAFIHSFVFVVDLGDNASAIDGLFFNSDKSKDKEVFYITLDDFFKIVQDAIKDEIVDFQITNLHTAELIRKSRKPRHVTRSK